MVIEKELHRRRVVKGWAFMDLTTDEIAAIREFLDTGDTDKLPTKFQRKDYSIYTTKH